MNERKATTKQAVCLGSEGVYGVISGVTAAEATAVRKAKFLPVPVPRSENRIAAILLGVCLLLRAAARSGASSAGTGLWPPCACMAVRCEQEVLKVLRGKMRPAGSQLTAELGCWPRLDRPQS